MTSPVGGAAVTIDAASGRVLQSSIRPDAAGIAAARIGFAVSSYDGLMLDTQSDVAWDQHIVRLPRRL